LLHVLHDTEKWKGICRHCRWPSAAISVQAVNTSPHGAGGMVVSAVIILGALLLTAMVLMRGDLYPSSPVQALNIAQHALM
jgi:hypothetical protein